ncbi:unnamed protein product [Camellia sinensis]
MIMPWPCNKTMLMRKWFMGLECWTKKVWGLESHSHSSFSHLRHQLVSIELDVTRQMIEKKMKKPHTWFKLSM